MSYKNPNIKNVLSYVMLWGVIENNLKILLNKCDFFDDNKKNKANNDDFFNNSNKELLEILLYKV